jgi:hypothetical protein
MSVIAFSKSIGPVPIDCLISEKHTSDLEITGNPIETGAEANDHAYIKPKEVVLEIGDENASATFQALTRFQESRVPFTLSTGLNAYKNMLVQSVQATRDAKYSKVLSATITLKEVKIVGMAGSGAGGLGGQPGGLNSLGAAPLSPGNVDGSIINKASPVVHIGDSPTSVVAPSQNISIAKRIFG